VIGIYPNAYSCTYCYTYEAAKDFGAAIKRHTYIFHCKPVSPLTPERNKSAYNRDQECMRQHNHFAENLIKGKIAETVFELMFREATSFDVYPLGYERSIPILRQFRDHHSATQDAPVSAVIENLSDTPDFLLTLPDKTQVYLVEVKYRRELKVSEIVRIAATLHARWHPATLFLATLSGFFYDACEAIVRHGEILPLADNLISHDTQAYYLSLLRRFEA
jgi:hypothetical protein